jgi:hypothetical protein
MIFLRNGLLMWADFPLAGFSVGGKSADDLTCGNVRNHVVDGAEVRAVAGLLALQVPGLL